MGESGSAWWLSADRKWRKGEPPAGWVQARDGRWHPPADQPATNELPAVDDEGEEWAEGQDAVGGRHLAGPDSPEGRHHRADGPARWPAWARLAAPIAVLVVAFGVIAAFVTFVAGAGPEGDERAGDLGLGSAGQVVEPGRSTGTTRSVPRTSVTTAETSSASSSSTTSSSTSSTTTTTGPSDDPTRQPPPGTDPFAQCSDEELATIQRGNRPWAWVLAHFDPDDDGILCE